MKLGSIGFTAASVDLALVNSTCFVFDLAYWFVWSFYTAIFSGE